MKELSDSLVAKLRNTYGAVSSLSNSPPTVTKAAEMVRGAPDMGSLRTSLDESPRRGA